MKINIKPLSVNNSWKGKRFRTDEYKAYKEELTLKLKKISIPNGELTLEFEVGYSSRGSDIDNFLKPAIDIISGYYDFNDNRIYSLHVNKTIVKKGDEFICFEITENHGIPSWKKGDSA